MMEELIKWLDPNFKYIEHYIQEQVLDIEIERIYYKKNTF